MRKPLIAGNWKMNLTWAAAVGLAQRISYDFESGYHDVDIVLCPPFTTIKGVANVLAFDRSDIKVGAQNCAETDPEGVAASTGEVSAAMLADLDCAYCIGGHSARRALAGESDEQVNRKARLLLERGLSPIVCCGESAELHEAGPEESRGFVLAQLRASLAGLSGGDFERLAIAYEPIWAIGTGRTPLPEDAAATCDVIRTQVREDFGLDAAENVRILYGGSLKAENAEQFLGEPAIDGGLVGGASLDALSFASIIRAAERAS
jgi:triosephosphate isomerase